MPGAVLTQVWLSGAAAGVTLDLSGTSQSYIALDSDNVPISGQVSGVATNSYTQARSPLAHPGVVPICLQATLARVSRAGLLVSASCCLAAFAAAHW